MCIASGTKNLIHENAAENYVGEMVLTFQEVYAPDLPLGCWIEQSASKLYIKFIFSSRIFYRGVPGFETDHCCVWCRG